MRIWIFLVGLALAGLGSGTASAADITYYLDLTVGAARVTGDIVTDGTIGGIANTNIVSWNLLLNVSTGPCEGAPCTVDLVGPIALPGQPPNASVNNSVNVSATSTQLLYNFSGALSDYFFFETGNIGVLCFATSSNCVTPASGAGESLLIYPCPDCIVEFTNLSGTQVIGSTAVLPTSVLPRKSCLEGPLVIFGCYKFTDVRIDAWVDPATASGYTYQMTNGSLFTEILDLPTGFLEPFTVTAPGCSIPGTFGPGQSVDFVALCGSGVSEFTVTGIDPMFDPTDQQAFPIQLAFNTPTADFIAEPLGSAVPEPSTCAMMLLGFAGLGFAGYRSARKAAPGT